MAIELDGCPSAFFIGLLLHHFIGIDSPDTTKYAFVSFAFIVYPSSFNIVCTNIFQSLFCLVAEPMFFQIMTDCLSNLIGVNGEHAFS